MSDLKVTSTAFNVDVYPDQTNVTVSIGFSNGNEFEIQTDSKGYHNQVLGCQICVNGDSDFDFEEFGEIRSAINLANKIASEYHKIINALADQKKIWLASATLWSDFSEDFEDGNRKHREAIEDDFLQENDAVDKVDERDDDLCDVLDAAMELRSECLYETLKEKGLL